MTTPWKKVFRDFWRERARTVLVVLAIALGISAFGAVLSSYAILTRELNAGYLATNPASATLFTDSVDDEVLAATMEGHGVKDAEARRSLRGRIKAGPAEWRGLLLFAVKDYGQIHIGRLKPQEGAWPPAAGEILIERDALQVARARIGDTVTVRTAGGSEQALRVSGTVHDVGQAQARMENVVYGYITLETLARLGERPILDQLRIEVAGDQFDEAHVRDVAAKLKTWLEGRGHPVRRVEVPVPGEHPHAAIMGLLLLAEAGFGLFALVLSGILVFNLLTALLASQVRQIGVMKAIGGAPAQIARIYLSQAILLGLGAFTVALPAGIWGGRLLSRALAVFLNFDVTSFAVPSWVYALELGVGLVVPLAAAAFPVAKGTGVSVREALADWGVAGNTFGESAFDRALAGVGGALRPTLLAVRNGFRHRTRLLLTVVTLTASGVFFMSALNVRASMIRTLDHLFDTMKFDLRVSLAEMVPFERLERATRKTPGVLRAEGWIATEAAVVSPADAPAATGGGGPHRLTLGTAGGSRTFTVAALPVRTRMLELRIVEGRNLKEGDTNAMVVNTQLAVSDPRMKVGSEVMLRMGPAEMPWRIVGKAREPFTPAVAYVPLETLEERGGHAGLANNVRLALERSDAASIAAVKASLDRNLEEEGVRAVSSASKADGRFGFDQHMVMIYVFLIVVSAVLLGVGGLGITTTMSLNVLERRREMGVLRALGAAPSRVGLMIVAEGAVIGALGGALAAAAAWPVGRLAGDLLVHVAFKSGLDFVFEWRGLLIWLVVSVSLGAAASAMPAWHASRVPVREAIGYE